MMSDCKKTTSLLYMLKKEDLILELERRSLSIESSLAVLRERLLRAERDDEDGSDSGSTHQGRDSGIQTGPLGEASALTPDAGMADRGSFAQQTDGVPSRDTSQPAGRANAASQTEYGFSDLTLGDGMDGEDEYDRRSHVRTRPSGYERSGPAPFEDDPIYVDTRRRVIPPSVRDPSFRTGRVYGRETGVRFTTREDQDVDGPFGEDLYPTWPFESTRATRRSDAQARPRVSDRRDDYYDFDCDAPRRRFDDDGPAFRHRDSRMRAVYDPDFEYDTGASRPPRSGHRESQRSPVSSNPAHAYDIMRKWNLKFSGTRREDPDAFPTRLDEGRSLVPICDSDLLRVMPFFLSGIALNWFRSSKYLWRTYGDFARACRRRFSDPDFQCELRQEIYRRTQGERESRCPTI